jgi:hypothetical protein
MDHIRPSRRALLSLLLLLLGSLPPGLSGVLSGAGLDRQHAKTRQLRTICDNAYSVKLSGIPSDYLEGTKVIYLYENMAMDIHFCGSSCASNHTSLEIVSQLGRGLFETCRTCLEPKQKEYSCDTTDNCASVTVKISKIPTARAIFHRIKVVDVRNSANFGLSEIFTIHEDVSKPIGSTAGYIIQTRLVIAFTMGIVGVFGTLFVIARLTEANDRLGADLGRRRQDFFNPIQMPQRNTEFSSVMHTPMRTSEEVITRTSTTPPGVGATSSHSSSPRGYPYTAAISASSNTNSNSSNNPGHNK